jgi:hypothetical protein
MAGGWTRDFSRHFITAEAVDCKSTHAPAVEAGARETLREARSETTRSDYFE